MRKQLRNTEICLNVETTENHIAEMYLLINAFKIRILTIKNKMVIIRQDRWSIKIYAYIYTHKILFL